VRDSDIRAALMTHVLATHFAEPGTLLRHELGICAGQRRVNVALINGEIAGWEIKSDEDTLTRLAGQVDAYGQVLDRATLVTTPRWVDRAVRTGSTITSAPQTSAHLDSQAGLRIGTERSLAAARCRTGCPA
jgi:hypothetical protein